MNTRLLLAPAGAGKTFTIKKEIIDIMLNSLDNVYVIKSGVFGRYNEYEYLVNKNKGAVISPKLGINKDLNPRFISYDVFIERDGMDYARYFAMALSDVFHKVINNTTKGIKSYIYLDEIGMYYKDAGIIDLIVDFVNVCKKYNCEVIIASQCKEEVERLFAA